MEGSNRKNKMLSKYWFEQHKSRDKQTPCAAPSKSGSDAGRYWSTSEQCMMTLLLLVTPPNAFDTIIYSLEHWWRVYLQPCMQHVIILRLLRQCVLLYLAEGRGLDANQSMNFNGALLRIACDFCLISIVLPNLRRRLADSKQNITCLYRPSTWRLKWALQSQCHSNRQKVLFCTSWKYSDFECSWNKIKRRFDLNMDCPRSSGMKQVGKDWSR